LQPIGIGGFESGWEDKEEVGGFVADNDRNTAMSERRRFSCL